MRKCLDDLITGCLAAVVTAAMYGAYKCETSNNILGFAVCMLWVFAPSLVLVDHIAEIIRNKHEEDSDV